MRKSSLRFSNRTPTRKSFVKLLRHPYGEDKLIRRSYWLDMDDRTLVMVMVNGIGANLTNDEKRLGGQGDPKS